VRADDVTRRSSSRTLLARHEARFVEVVGGDEEMPPQRAPPAVGGRRQRGRSAVVERQQPTLVEAANDGRGDGGEVFAERSGDSLYRAAPGPGNPPLVIPAGGVTS